jgi:hypothetical protein
VIVTKACATCGGTFTGSHQAPRCAPCKITHKKELQARILRSPNGRWLSGKYAARNRGVAWDISPEEHAELLAHPCDYCGNELNKSGSGLDRIEPGAYRIDNVVPCCWPCNRLRNFGAFTYEEMKALGEALGPIWRSHGPSNLCLGGRPWRGPNHR